MNSGSGNVLFKISTRGRFLAKGFIRNINDDRYPSSINQAYFLTARDHSSV